MAEGALVQPGWRVPRALIERVDRAWHWRMAQGGETLTKSEFVADLIAGALARPEAQQGRPTAATEDPAA